MRSGNEKRRTIQNTLANTNATRITHPYQPMISGIYFYRLQTDTQIVTRKMLLLK
ncbi:MAG: T9SS type A sorting domain-containing protein [candidate division Zixibacteria bacterium]|nr:T9SS type A sorting domain-containing protein [candidate division Zixibacteria bacterium]